MRPLLALLLCLPFGLVFASNNIIAIVNDNIITLTSIEQQLNNGRSIDEKIEVIDQQIDNLLIQEQITNLGIKPTQLSIEAALAQIAKTNAMSIEQLQALPQFPTLLRQIINQLSIRALQQNAVQEIMINLTDEEIRAKCQNSASKNNSKQIKIAQIIISEIEGAKDQESAIKELLNKIAKHVENGASFYNFAKLHSQDHSYTQGGLSDWLTIEGSNLSFFDNLEEGEVSKIYNSGRGWAIAIKTENRYINSNLEGCKQKIINDKVTKHYLDWVQELRSTAYIEIFSDKL